MKAISTHAHKTGSWYLTVTCVLFKICNKQPFPWRIAFHVKCDHLSGDINLDNGVLDPSFPGKEVGVTSEIKAKKYSILMM